MGSGVSKGHSGRRPHFGRSPAGLQEIPGGAPRPPPLGAPPKACRGAASTILKRPAPVAALRPPEGFLKTPFWGVGRSRDPPEPPPCRLHRGSQGGGGLEAVDWCYRRILHVFTVPLYKRYSATAAPMRAGG